jgi:hypothetical protein
MRTFFGLTLVAILLELAFTADSSACGRRNRRPCCCPAQPCCCPAQPYVTIPPATCACDTGSGSSCSANCQNGSCYSYQSGGTCYCGCGDGAFAGPKVEGYRLDTGTMMSHVKVTNCTVGFLDNLLELSKKHGGIYHNLNATVNFDDWSGSIENFATILDN